MARDPRSPVSMRCCAPPASAAAASPRRTSRATTNASASTAWKPATPSLIESFERIEAARGDITLTFFEYNALAALDLFQRARRRRGGARGGSRRSARRHQHHRCGRRRGLFHRPRSRRLAGRYARADRTREGRHLSRRAPGGARQRGRCRRRCGRPSRRSARAPWCPAATIDARRTAIGWDFEFGDIARCAICRCRRLPGAHQIGNAATALAAIAAGGFGVELTHADRQPRRCAMCASRGGFSACRARSSGFSMWPTTCRRPRRCATICARCRARAHALPCAEFSATRTFAGSPRRWRPTSMPGFSWLSTDRAPSARSRLAAQLARRRVGAWRTRATWRRPAARRAPPRRPGDRVLVFGSFLTVGPALEFLGL